jgi:hypothetical protein
MKQIRRERKIRKERKGRREKMTMEGQWFLQMPFPGQVTKPLQWFTLMLWKTL